jgi:hypothetical protein
MAELSQVEKQTFLAATNRKIERGKRAKLIRMFADAEQVEAFYEIWKVWLDRWSKERAMDALITSVCDAEARYQDLVALLAERKRKKVKHAKAQT